MESRLVSVNIPTLRPVLLKLTTWNPTRSTLVAFGKWVRGAGCGVGRLTKLRLLWNQAYDAGLCMQVCPANQDQWERIAMNHC
jgi:hypothetical protein